MLNALTILVLCQFAGEVTARSVSLPLPGPVVGLVLLLVWLLARRRAPGAGLRQVSGWLLGHFGLLFVPAGVGVITQLDVIEANWLPLLPQSSPGTQPSCPCSESTESGLQAAMERECRTHWRTHWRTH